MTYTCDAVDAMEIQVDFERNANTHVVKYESLNKFATITATADGTDFKTGAAINKGAKVVFTAHPIEGYSVDSWLLDGEVIIGEKNNTYIIESLNSDVQISLICSKAEPEKPNKPVVNGEHLVSWQPVGPAVTPDGVTIIDTRAFRSKQNDFVPCFQRCQEHWRARFSLLCQLGENKCRSAEPIFHRNRWSSIY